MSEKIDDFRAKWTGSEFVSREGNVFAAPQWFKDGLGDVALDGGLFLGRGMFYGIRGAMRDGWHGLTFQVFDAPDHAGTFRQRLAFLQTLSLPPHVQPVEHIRCNGTVHLIEYANAVCDAGGEGAVVRNPRARWAAGRSDDVLRFVPQCPSINRRKVA